MNLKEKIQAVIDRCVFVENDIAFRCRGAGELRESAWVTAINCTVYQTSRVFRLEANVANVKISHLATGEGVARKFDGAPGPGAGYLVQGEREAPALKPWPYVALPIGDLGPVESGSAATPAQLATGASAL